MHSSLGPALIGAGVGFFSGMLGKGGSAVTTPLLRMFLGTPSLLALASPLPMAVPMTLSAAAAYRGKGLVDWRLARTTCAWGLPATVAGALASRWVGGRVLMQLTALFVAGLGVHVLRSPEEPASAAGRPPRAAAAAIGVGVGLLSGLLANTGGILYAPLFVSVLRLPIKRALATSLVVSAALAVPGTAAHAWLGHVDWALAAALAAGAVPSAYLGARLAVSLRSRALIRVYGLSLALFGIYDFLYVERFWLPRLGLSFFR
ncbi:MAG TPA: sulfite exporter TauE/SafE family protein [Elusimicrobiota bacterium]|jgi:uncharacterized membrane protein YfcA|nr:sulfite exporter TauE/SafE family protein [Elusimicrobiota bacterium]